MISNFVFLFDYELNKESEKFKERGQKVILWGTGTTVIPIEETLNDCGIEIDFYGSGDAKENDDRKGKRVLSYEEMAFHKEDMVIIGSFAYVPVISKLFSLGVTNVFGLREVYKYPLSKIKKDQIELKKSSFCISSCSDKILVELYGNIGDVIVRIGIVEFLIHTFGKESVYLLFGSEENAELYRYVTDNIFVLSEDTIRNDVKRLSKLKEIWDLKFTESFVLCDTKIVAQRRILNRYNCNIPKISYSDCLPNQEYLVGLDIERMKGRFSLEKTDELEAWGRLESEKLPEVNNLFSEKYVSISLGASKRLRQYSAEQFLMVCHYLIRIGYELVILGKGVDEEEMAEILLEDEKVKSHSINLVSKLSLSQSAKVISKSDFFVGCESGLWNISYALGIPSVVIYGGGDYGSFYHQNPLIKYASVHKMDCFFCKWFCSKTDKQGIAECINNISPRNIIEKIEELIKHIKQ